MRLAGALLALAAFLHLYRLSEPARVVFDEVHFADQASAYCGSHGYFFDVHPPHAKLLIAGVAALGGYRGDQSFESLDDPIDQVSPALLRLAPALAGSVLPAVVFGLLLQLGASEVAAFLGGLATALDNAILLETRIVVLDGILLLACFGSLSTLLAALGTGSPRRRAALAVGAGALAGLAVGTKFTGLVALALDAVCIGANLLRGPSWRAAREATGVAALLLTGAIVTYVAGWELHFALLTEPGPGYAWAAPTGDFVSDALRVHRLMLTSNYTMTATHPYASPWWSWPLMLRPIYYWRHGDAALYFLGNPVVWWGTTLGLLLVLANGVLLRISDLSLPGRPAWPRPLWVPLLGFAIALLPLVAVPRVLFLYHYLTAQLFGLCAVIRWLDHIGWTRAGGWGQQRRSVFVAMAGLVLAFLAISPFTFSFIEAPAYRELVFGLFPGWR